MFLKSEVDIYCWNIMNGPLILIISCSILSFFISFLYPYIQNFKDEKILH